MVRIAYCSRPFSGCVTVGLGAIIGICNASDSRGAGVSVTGVISKLNAGYGITIFKKLVYSSSGSFYPRVIVDPENKILELDESNNDVSMILVVS